MDPRNPLEYFVDPILRAPTIGSMLMCLMASLVGVIVFLRKQSLLGETLSHAAYPGVILGVVGAALSSTVEGDQPWVAGWVIGGAFVASLVGLFTIRGLVKYLNVASDSALAFVLASFFGIGLTVASRVQVTHTTLYRQIEMYLYGQAATMTDHHIWLYGVLSLVAILFVVVLYKELQIINFDRDYAASLGISTGFVELMFFVLTVLAVVVGISWPCRVREVTRLAFVCDRRRHSTRIATAVRGSGDLAMRTTQV